MSVFLGFFNRVYNDIYGRVTGASSTIVDRKYIVLDCSLPDQTTVTFDCTLPDDMEL